MPKKNESTEDYWNRLRQEAERTVQRQIDAMEMHSPEEIYHELRVHQVELEMQNQQLRETQLELQQALERFTSLYHESPVGYVTIDAGGRIHDLNESFAAMCGQSIFSLRQTFLADHLNDSTQPILRQRLPAFYRQPEGKVLELTLQTREGTTVDVELQGRHLPSAADEAALLACNLIDITLRKQAERQRQQLEMELRQKHKMEAIGIMAGGIAHDFNNSLAIMLGNVEMSQLKAGSDEELQQRLADTKTAILRARDLIKQILVYSRQAEQQLKPVCFAEVVDETLRLLKATIPATVSIETRLHESGMTIHADFTQIQEVLINLCSNAVHAMHEQGTLTISLERCRVTTRDIPVQFSEARGGDYVCLSVADTGCGMSQQDLGKIFDPFYTTKEVGQGTGMGLAVAQGIVERHGGFIRVISEPDRGSCFQIYLPFIPGSVDSVAPRAEECLQGSETILLIDDEEMLLELWKNLLEAHGYRVEAYADPGPALDRFRQQPDDFDLVITDQTLPGFSGTELIAQIRAICPRQKVILCSGFSHQVDERQAAEHGVATFIQKPADLPVMLKQVRKVLDWKDQG